MIFETNIKINNSDKRLQELKKDNSVVVFGTGNFGKIISYGLKINNINILGFGDNNRNNWETKFDNFNVYSIENLKKKFLNTPIVVASLSFSYIKKQLAKHGFTKIYDCESIFLNTKIDLSKCNTDWSAKRCKEQIDNYLFSIDSEYKRKNNLLHVKHLDLVLTEKCSLKCKDCSNLMQYYAKPIDEDYDNLIKGLDKFMNSVDFVNEIRFIGGEPLLYKKIGDVMKKVLTYKNFKKIYIYTNGTIVFKNNKMEIFRDERVLFRISDYGKISRNVKPLEKELERLKVNYITEEIRRWQDCAKIKLYERDPELTKFIYGNCCVNQYLTLLHGKLYLCPFQAHAENLKAIPKDPKDSIDLLAEDMKQIKEKMYSLYFDTEVLSACNYCNGRDPNVENVVAAEQAKEPLKYKIIEN